MQRQQGIPLLLSTSSGEMQQLEPVTEQDSGAVSESFIRDLVHRHPACLPITEIDEIFSDAVSICTELNTPVGPIDVFMVTPSGLPVLIECKLWRNPEARRQVVSQILDYAKELSRWSSADVQREVRNRLKRDGDPLVDMVRAAHSAVDEQRFHDALTANLRRGRFLLLIVGDGIRERVEAIAEYLQLHAGLHFSLGLVELPVYRMRNGDRLVVPRVLARTVLITRNVVAVPDGYVVDPTDDHPIIEPGRAYLAEEARRFWAEFINDFLNLEDPEQPKPRPSRLGYITLSLPAPTSWLTVYRALDLGEVGIFISCWRDTAGAYAIQSVVDEFSVGGPVRDELGENVRMYRIAGNSRDSLIDSMQVGPLEQPEVRKRAFSWLAERVNTFVRALRPRMRAAAADYASK